MLAAVERLPRPRVVQPEVGAAVDRRRRRRRQLPRRSAPDWPCGSARKTTSWPASVSTVVSLEHPVGQRDQVRLERAERLARRSSRPVRAPISTAGWPSSRRSSSPPAYPLAPATATRVLVMCMIIHGSCMFMRNRVPTPDRTSGCGRRRSRLGCWAWRDSTSPTYLQHIRDESQRFRDVLADCDPAAAVPSCPDWRAADLLWHLGEVQHFWTWTVDAPAQGPGRVHPSPSARPTTPGCWRLRRALRRAGRRAGARPTPPTTAWTWHAEHKNGRVHPPPPGPRGADPPPRRRAGRPHALAVPDPTLAADGVDEVLDVMYGGLPALGRVRRRSPTTSASTSPTPATTVWVQLGRFRGTDPDGDRTTTRTTSTSSATPGSSPTRWSAAPAGAARRPASGAAATAPTSTSPATCGSYDHFRWRSTSRSPDRCLGAAGGREPRRQPLELDAGGACQRSSPRWHGQARWTAPVRSAASATAASRAARRPPAR